MYLQQAYKGQNEFWRYMVTFFIVVAAQFLGSIPMSIVFALKQSSGQAATEFKDTFNPEVLGISQNEGLILLMLPMVLTFFALIISMRFIHGHSFKNIFTSASQFRWKNFFFAFFVWGGMLLIAELITYQLQPDNYVFNFDPASFYQLLLIALLLIPLQASAEELYLRGNLMQGVAIWTRSRLAALFATSIIFGLLHFSNPEVKAFGFLPAMAYYIGFGLLMGILVIFDGGLEMPLAIHSINNIYGAVFVGYSGSVLQTPTLYKVVEYNANGMLLLFVIAAVIFLFIGKKLFKWTPISGFSDRLTNNSVVD